MLRKSPSYIAPFLSLIVRCGTLTPPPTSLECGDADADGVAQLAAGATIKSVSGWHGQPSGTAVPAQKVMKQMLKPFKPAEPRFEGLNTDVSEETGAVVLLDGAAYLECTVGNRLEARSGMRTICRARLQDEVHRVAENAALPSAAVAKPILPDLCAELWQAGDHWVVYGTVDGGKVLDEAALTSIHQRKSGTTY